MKPASFSVVSAVGLTLSVWAVARPAADQTKPTQATAPRPAAAQKAASPSTPVDAQLTTRYVAGAQMSENTTYVRGPRQRVEFPGVVTIDQCDLKRSVVLNDAEKRYRIQPYPAAASASGAPVHSSSEPAKKGGVVTYVTTLTDTLERKPLFGLEARHIRTVIVREASENACDKTPQRVEIDAWYVDLPERAICEIPVAAADPPGGASACTDRIETRVAGVARLGLPMLMQTTTTSGSGDDQETSSTSMEVTNFTLTTLEASLFEVPSDYAEAKSAADLLPSLAKGGSLAEALMGSTAAGTATAAPKRAGTIRVGVLEPVNRSGRELPTQTMREELVAMYRKAPYEALPLAGDSPAAIAQDASRLECDYILFTEVAEVKTSKPGKVGGLLRRAAGDGSSQPKHDVRIDYKLYPVADTRTARANGSGKASTGGFGVGSALRMAAFAGQTYMRFMGLGRMGGLMNPLMSMPGMGGGLGAGMGFFDPRASAMSSMAQMALGGGLPGLGGLSGLDGPENAGLPETISEAVSNTARDTIEQLNKPKK